MGQQRVRTAFKGLRAVVPFTLATACPAAPAPPSAPIDIHGVPYDLSFYTPEIWAEIPEPRRPRDARAMGGGYYYWLRPSE